VSEEPCGRVDKHSPHPSAFNPGTELYKWCNGRGADGTDTLWRKQVSDGDEPWYAQVARLASFIQDEAPGEVEHDRNAIETAIRLLGRAKELHGDRAFSADGRALRMEE
jgi:hypothetical protein